MTMLILHYISFIIVLLALLLEHVMMKPSLSRAALRKLVIIDGVYGTAFLLVFLSGLGLAFWSEAEFRHYLSNTAFVQTLVLFFVIALISAYPSFRYLLLWKGALNETVELPVFIIWIIRLELAVLAVFVWLGYVMRSA